MIAAVTMVYNEPEFLPLWIKYYGEQVGKENCFIIDNSSDDGSIEQYKSDVNIIRVPRLYKDNQLRTRFLSDFCNSLLHYFTNVIHVDVDEFIVPNPYKYENLTDYVTQWKTSEPSVTSIGLNVTQLPSQESGIDFSSPILEQRSFVRFVSPMCKPCIIRKPINWTAGFHGSDHKVNFNDIFMFHLRYFDQNYGLKRLERTRTMAWKSEKEGLHQRVEDETWNKWFVNFERFKMLDKFISEQGLNEDLSNYLSDLLENTTFTKSKRYKIPMATPNTLFKIPSAFKAFF